MLKNLQRLLSKNLCTCKSQSIWQEIMLFHRGSLSVSFTTHYVPMLKTYII